MTSTIRLDPSTPRASRAEIEEFLSQRVLALAGASRGGRGFGNAVRRVLAAQGRRVLVVHPDAGHIDGVDGAPCWFDLAALPEPAGGVVVVVPPPAAVRVVEDAARAGIRRVWLQQGAESEAAVAFCRREAMSVVWGECILMFAEPAGFPHRAHRWVRGVFGKLPA